MIWHEILSRLKSLERDWWSGAYIDLRISPRTLSQAELGLVELMRATILWNKCREPKDLLFSRTGLSFDVNLFDFSYNPSAAETFLEFATRSAQNTGSIEIIQFSTFSHMDLPTWCLDWTQQSSSGWALEDRWELEAVTWSTIVQ